MDAAAFRRRHHGARRAEHCELPQREGQLPFAHASFGSPGIGPKTFEQAAGFLRIRNGDDPLDGRPFIRVVPGVEQIAASLKTTVKAIILDPQLLEKWIAANCLPARTR